MNFECFFGKIYSKFKPIKEVEAIIVANGRIIFAGDSYRAEKISEELGAKKIKLQGVIMPAFIDSHVHLDLIGEYLNQLDLRNVKSISELKEKLREYSARTNYSWIYGRGWDQELFQEKRYPTRWDLDDVENNKAVILSRFCGHAAVLNTKAMELVGLLNVFDQDIVRDDKGNPIGLIREKAVSLALEKYRESLSDKELEKFLLDAMKYSASQGVATVGIAGCSLRILNILIKLNVEKRQIIRIRAYIRLNGNKEILRKFKEMGIRKGYGDDFLKIMGFKIIFDGALGVRTAYLSEPYSDDAYNYGQINLDENSLVEIVKEADEAGLQMAIHAIGDKASDIVINAYKEARNFKVLRHRIEHASLLREDQIKIISQLGIPLAIQPHFIISDWWAKKRVGEKRIKWLYAFNSMLRNGINISLSTDSPVEPLNPWETVYASVTRGKYEKIEYYEDTKHECLSLEDALHAYTYGSAYILHEENNLGSLEEGKFADFIVVNEDPFNVSEEELNKIKIMRTYINGKLIFDYLENFQIH